MSQTPDEPDNPADSGSGQGSEGSGRKLDEDAAWREIIAHYDDATAPDPVIDRGRPADPGPATGSGETGQPPSSSGPLVEPDSTVDPHDDRLRRLFRPGWDEAMDPAEVWDEEEHFVPPTPPPLPALDPRRRLAWAGLFGSPMLMVLDVVFGWRLPDWLLFLVAASFAGGFIYLVATMPKRPGDGHGDDGAVV